MGTGWFDRMATNLRGQQRNLLDWMKSSSHASQILRLGGRSVEDLHDHVRVLEHAIQKAETDELGICTVCHEHVGESWLETNYTYSVCIDHLSGEERLRAAFMGLRTAAPADIVQGLLRSVRDFTRNRPLADDTTILACRRTH